MSAKKIGKNGRQGEGGGRPAHERDEEIAKQVSAHAAVGTSHDDIAAIVKMSTDTLLKYYRSELDLGLSKANAAVGGKIYSEAMKGKAWACTLWAKARMGWVTERHEHSGPNAGAIEIDEVSVADDLVAELLAKAESLGTGSGAQ